MNKVHFSKESIFVYFRYIVFNVPNFTPQNRIRFAECRPVSTGSVGNFFPNGDGEIRTHDPLLARQVLSQLSYTPILIWQPPTLPSRLQLSTIGRLSLNHRVRDENGCAP